MMPLLLSLQKNIYTFIKCITSYRHNIREVGTRALHGSGRASIFAGLEMGDLDWAYLYRSENGFGPS